jgi:riboflavin kinase/FMN adenylyltransferase
VQSFNIAHLIIGYDHRFGRNREATVDDLINAGSTYGFSVEKIEAQDIASVNVSSTKIRNALEEGKMKIATAFLSRPFRLSGKVITGEKIGRTIGFPTANLQIEEDYKLLPCDGVFFVKTQHYNSCFYGMMNVGFRPTLEGEQRSFEVHLFDFDQDLYGETLQVDLLELIRKEKKFASLEELKAQLQEDQAKCRKLIPAK